MESLDYQRALIDEAKDLPEEVWPNLLQIICLFKASVLPPHRQEIVELRAEFAQWDHLSDEALEQFEKDLG